MHWQPFLRHDCLAVSPQFPIFASVEIQESLVLMLSARSATDIRKRIDFGQNKNPTLKNPISRLVPLCAQPFFKRYLHVRRADESRRCVQVHENAHNSAANMSLILAKFHTSTCSYCSSATASSAVSGITAGSRTGGGGRFLSGGGVRSLLTDLDLRDTAKCRRTLLSARPQYARAPCSQIP